MQLARWWHLAMSFHCWCHSNRCLMSYHPPRWSHCSNHYRCRYYSMTQCRPALHRPDWAARGHRQWNHQIQGRRLPSHHRPIHRSLPLPCRRSRLPRFRPAYRHPRYPRRFHHRMTRRSSMSLRLMHHRQRMCHRSMNRWSSMSLRPMTRQQTNHHRMNRQTSSMNHLSRLHSRMSCPMSR